jgi:ArsR family transcriptional regulator, arsenate/arsenite/antimonite-responsive transcriptional repressor
MGTTKKLVFDDSIYQTANVFKALGNPARLQILQILLEKKSCTCGTIVALLPLAQSTVSKHLLELKKVHIVSIKIDGKKIIYSLINENLNFVKDFLSNHLDESKKEPLEITLKTNKAILLGKSNKRKANPSLKNQNYTFSHLTLKKVDK